MLTVTVPAKRSNLIDVSAARSALGLSDSSDDALLKAYIDRASDVIGRHCNRTFARETVQETIRNDVLRPELILSRYPVVSIDSIVENDAVLDPADYEYNRDNGIITRLYGNRPCWWPHGLVVVEYQSGYDLPRDCPPALAHAAVQLVKAFYFAGDRDPMVRQDSVENLSSATYTSAAMPRDVVQILSSFKSRIFR